MLDRQVLDDFAGERPGQPFGPGASRHVQLNLLREAGMEQRERSPNGSVRSDDSGPAGDIREKERPGPARVGAGLREIASAGFSSRPEPFELPALRRSPGRTRGSALCVVRGLRVVMSGIGGGLQPPVAADHLAAARRIASRAVFRAVP